MIKFFQNIIKNFKENKTFKENNKILEEENKTLKETILKLDPNFKIIPFLKVLNIQNWKTANNEIFPIDMGYFDNSINTLQNFVLHNAKELYILLRKITSEQMNEIDARNFIYALFFVLERADDIPNLEVQFQIIIASKNKEAIKKYGVLR